MCRVHYYAEGMGWTSWNRCESQHDFGVILQPPKEGNHSHLQMFSSIEEGPFLSTLLLLKTMQEVILARKMFLKCMYGFIFHDYHNHLIHPALLQYISIYSICSARYCVRGQVYRKQQNHQPISKYIIYKFW